MVEKVWFFKKWHKEFWPEIENIDLIPTWVSLLNLPIIFWHASVIARIANGIGSLVSNSQ